MPPGLPIWLVMVMWLLSITFGVIAAAAMVTYVRRTWQLIQADEDGSSFERILDGIDQIDTRLEAVNERLGRLEERDQFLLEDGDSD